ncbi:MAG: CHAD domain-containing protein [Dermatophilaceae bacterium]|nr:CHAD domain-containing protein [Intrasporangiaceae bacterium]
MLIPGGAPASPATKASEVIVPVTATAGEAIQIAIDACLAHLRPNESCWLETEHADCLHQTRVSTRRLRALLSLSRRLVRDDQVAMDLKTRLRLILMPLGPARDLDVALIRAREEGWSAADLDRLDDARTDAYAGVREVLTGAPWQEVWADLDRWRHASGWLDHVAAWRDGPARGVTDEALDRRYRRIILAGPHLLHMSDHALHRIRIEGKKLRYGCQFFDTLYPEAGTVMTEDGREISMPLHLAEVMAGLQDAFGLFNDDAVAAGLRAELGLESGSRGERPTRLQCVEAWERVAALPPFWRLT